MYDNFNERLDFYKNWIFYIIKNLLDVSKKDTVLKFTLNQLKLKFLRLGTYFYHNQICSKSLSYILFMNSWEKDF